MSGKANSISIPFIFDLQLAEMSMESPSHQQIMSYFEKNVVNTIKTWQLTDRSRREREEKSLNQFVRDVASGIQLKVDNLTMTSSEVSSESYWLYNY